MYRLRHVVWDQCQIERCSNLQSFAITGVVPRKGIHESLSQQPFCASIAKIIPRLPSTLQHVTFDIYDRPTKTPSLSPSRLPDLFCWQELEDCTRKWIKLESDGFKLIAFPPEDSILDDIESKVPSIKERELLQIELVDSCDCE